MYLIRSPAGLKLQWYHSTGMMVIDTDSSSNKLRTMGLCGKSWLPDVCERFKKNENMDTTAERSLADRGAPCGRGMLAAV